MTDKFVSDPIPPITLKAVLAAPDRSPTKSPKKVAIPETSRFSTLISPKVEKPLTESSVIEPIPPITLVAVKAVPERTESVVTHSGARSFPLDLKSWPDCPLVLNLVNMNSVETPAPAFVWFGEMFIVFVPIPVTAVPTCMKDPETKSLSSIPVGSIPKIISKLALETVPVAVVMPLSVTGTKRPLFNAILPSTSRV